MPQGLERGTIIKWPSENQWLKWVWKQVMMMPRIGWLSSMGSRSDVRRVNKRFHKIKRYGYWFGMPTWGLENNGLKRSSIQVHHLIGRVDGEYEIQEGALVKDQDFQLWHEAKVGEFKWIKWWCRDGIESDTGALSCYLHNYFT